MSPAGNKTELRNTTIATRLRNWADQDGTGVSFGSNTLFTLPNGAKRGPDAAWVSKRCGNRLTEEEKESFSNLAPEFVIELRSKSDRLTRLKEKMEEYIANGVKLAWLLRSPGKARGHLSTGSRAAGNRKTTVLVGDPVLPGFQFNFKEIL
jgi:Uma2 family endonuclease